MDNNIGIASLMERREGKIGGQNYFYYTNLGLVIVMEYPTSYGRFRILSGTHYDKVVNKHTHYEEVMVTNFMSFKTLSDIHNTTKIEEILKIMASYHKEEGKYFVYDHNKNGFKPINDEDIIKQIEENAKNQKLQLNLKNNGWQ